MTTRQRKRKRAAARRHTARERMFDEWAAAPRPSFFNRVLRRVLRRR